MGSTGSTENKEETTVKKEDNTNEVVYHQDGMKVINIHGETVLISLAATAIIIFFTNECFRAEVYICGDV